MDSAPFVSDAEFRRARRAQLQRLRRERQRLAGDPAIQRYKEANAEAMRQKRKAESEEDKLRRLAARAEARKRKREARDEAKKRRRQDPEVLKAEAEAKRSKRRENAAIRQADNEGRKQRQIKGPARLQQLHATANNPTGHVCSVCGRLWHKRDLTPLPRGKQCVLQFVFNDSDLSAFKLCRTCLQSVNANKIPNYSTTEGYVCPPKSQHLPPLNNKSNVTSPRPETPSAVDDIATQKDSTKLCKKHASTAVTSTGTSTFSSVCSISTQTEVTDNGTQTAGILYGKGTQTQFLHLIFTDAQSEFMFHGSPHHITTNAAAQADYIEVKNSSVGAEESSHALQGPHVPSIKSEAYSAFDGIATEKESPGLCKKRSSIATASSGTSICSSVSSTSTQSEVADEGTQTAGILYGKGTQTPCLLLTSLGTQSESMFYALNYDADRVIAPQGTW